MNDGIVVEVVYGGHEALFEFLFGDDTDVAAKGNLVRYQTASKGPNYRRNISRTARSA
jgi:hypothetical protein